MDDTDAAALDCQTCGACCHGDDGWVHVGAEDDARVAEAPALRRVVVLLRHGEHAKRSLRMVDGACAALRRAGGRVACSIYADRPQVCREVAVGSVTCRAARSARGLAEAPS